MVKYILIVCVLVAALGIVGMSPDCTLMGSAAVGARAPRVPCHASFITQVDSQPAHPWQASVILASILMAFIPPLLPVSALSGHLSLAPRPLAAKPLTPPPRTA